MTTDSNDKDGRTSIIDVRAGQCIDINDLQEFLDKYREYFIDWKAHIIDLVHDFGPSFRQFAERCGMSQRYYRID